jgi:hypothetical protein
VIKAHTTDFPNPLILKAGDILKTEPKKTEWPGWVWCTEKDGNSGWIPANYLEIENNTARMRCDYNATELTAQIGDILNVLDEESSWYWCVTPRGSKGWIPKDNVEPI